MGEFEELEFEDVDVGTSRSPRREHRQRPPGARRPWWPWAVGAGLAAVVVGSIALTGTGDNSDTGPTTTRHRRTTTIPESTTTEPLTTPWRTLPPLVETTAFEGTTVVDTEAPSRFAIFSLPEPTGLRLIARTTDFVLDVDLDAGIVQRYSFPSLQSTGPVFTVAGDGWVVIRPLDRVPGWLVGREQGFEPLAGGLGDVDGLYPGPFGSLWRVDTTLHEMSLVDPDANKVGVDIPIAGARPIAPDGALGVLMSGTGGTYVADAAGIHRVTTGDVLATGPNTMLVYECDESLVCVRVVVDRTTGERRLLAGQTPGPSGPVGAISPDGSVAAIIGPGPRDGLIRLTDMATGTVNSIGAANMDGGLVWTANSQYLFYVGIDGGVHMWDRSDPGQRYVLDLGDVNFLQVVARFVTS